MSRITDEFKSEREYEKIWDTIRTKRIGYLYNKTKDIIDILQNNIDDKMLFHSSKNAKELLCLVDSKFNTIYQFKDFQQEIIYTGSEHRTLTEGKNISTHFNGAIFRLVDDKNNTLNIGRTYFKILGDD